MKAYTIKVNQFGNKEWRNEQGQLHREDGPAVECVDGTKLWAIDGELMTEEQFLDYGKPIVWSENSRYYSLGKTDLDDGPAVERTEDDAHKK